MNSNARVSIVGAGAIGLGLGWRLAQAGLDVDLFDRGAAGRGASWAAAGMLAAAAESESDHALLYEFGRRSQDLWPSVVTELESATRLDLDYRRDGTLIAAVGSEESARLRQDFADKRALGARLEWLSADEARRREPALAAEVSAAMLAPGDCWIDNRKFVAALKFAFLRAGGHLHERCEVVDVEKTGGRASHVVAADGTNVAADVVAITTGWTSVAKPIEGVPALPIVPVKGEMLALRGFRSRRSLGHVVRGASAYVVPRRDGRLIVGATSHVGQADDAVSSSGVASLLSGALRLMPATAGMSPIDLWAGIRPGSRDGLPLLGETSVPGLLVAVGHYRNGILWAPITAHILSRLIRSGDRDPFLDHFSPARRALSPNAQERAGHREEETCEKAAVRSP